MANLSPREAVFLLVRVKLQVICMLLRVMHLKIG